MDAPDSELRGAAHRKELNPSDSKGLFEAIFDKESS